ncbi:acyltransferase domain-containing protein [Nocardia yamanashiensis]|uniref:type I polyketide synthase n=1 Tax=Nocardia yamanashiensis TaxID=209247 RepID=UPI001E2B49F6|nr:type I polyketide synthase [Nocardia yamanashiensis]UGT42566.1 acyltransferase domain-containing protein [Nocardia yamanashiensis]
MTASLQQPSTGQRELLEQALRELREARRRLDIAEQARHRPVAVLGMGVRMPGDANSPDQLWDLFSSGTDTVSTLRISEDGRRGRTATAVDGKWASLLSEIDKFDAGFFGISSDEADHMDPQQRLFLEVAWEAIEDAGITLRELQSRRVGVFLGLYGTDYVGLQFQDPSRLTAYTAPGGAHSMAANRVSYLLDLRGPSIAVDTACSSSLVAVHLATKAVRNGDCDLAIVGGVNVILSPLSTLVTEKVLPLAPSGRCRTFDAAADGIVRAEGCGVVLLGTADEAGAPGRRARALIRGTATGHNGRANGLTAPNPKAQADLLRAALADGKVDAAQVRYIEAHGTGTILGDPIEVEALREVYGREGARCAMGSAKTNFGHQEAAAGITGLIKSILVLEHREVPPHLHFRSLNPEIELEGTRLFIPTESAAIETEGEPLCAAVSSFGFGGANAHVVLQEPPVATQELQGKPAATRPLVLPLSARSIGALRVLASRYADLIERGPEHAADICAAAALSRDHHRIRRCVDAESAAELVRALRRPFLAAESLGPGTPRVAFVFSGQGNQWAEMGRELMAAEPVVKQVIENCDEIVGRRAGWSIIEQLHAPQASTGLDRTETAQICVAAVQLGLDALWRSWGVRPTAVVGHSMGEIIALCAAGALDLEQAFELLLRRAAVCEAAARGGAMASVELPESEVLELVKPMSDRVGIAAVNGPHATVIAGESEAVAAILAAAAARGIRGKRLPGNYGFHSPLLNDSAALLGMNLPVPRGASGSISIYSTVTGQRLDPTQLDPAHWHENLRNPVRFAQAITAAARDGATVFVEIGPHPVLLRHIGETLEDLGFEHREVGSLHRNRTGFRYESLARMYEVGLTVDWRAFADHPAVPITLPTYPWQYSRHWLQWLDTDDSARADEAVPDPTPTIVLPPTTGERVDVVVGYIRERLAQVLEVDDVDVVPMDVRVEDLDLDSLVIVELKNRAEQDLGVRVPLAPLLEGGTPIELATAIVASLEAATGEIDGAA